MAKITRNSYKRKIIMFGIMLFVSIALISTGFAAWVLSTQKTKDSTGNVTIGSVTDASFEISYVEIKNQYDEVLTDSKGELLPEKVLQFSFEPEKGDENGRVRWDGNNYENLALTFKVKVTNFQYLGTFNVKMTVLNSIKDAVSNKYLELPECLSNESGVNLYDSRANGNKYADGVTYEEVGQDGQKTGAIIFTYTIKFNWGDAFGKQNPSAYYDSTDGLKVDDDTVKSTLDAFYALMDESEENNKFTITFTAKAK